MECNIENEPEERRAAGENGQEIEWLTCDYERQKRQYNALSAEYERIHEEYDKTFQEYQRLEHIRNTLSEDEYRRRFRDLHDREISLHEMGESTRALARKVKSGADRLLRERMRLFGNRSK